MISGPIASGKSTLAAEVASRLRREGTSTALVGLDSVAEMALPSLPDWELAHQVHAQLVGLWLDTTIDTVIAEGTATPREVALVLAHVPAGVSVLHVVLFTDFEVALARAHADPDRGASKDRVFLRRDHEDFEKNQADLPCDLGLRSDGSTPAALAKEVLKQIVH